MHYNTESRVEEFFGGFDSLFQENLSCCRTRTLVTDNYIVLGQLTSLRFIEWVGLNPGGVVALPTGKTPEFFIKWMEYYLNNWDRLKKHGIIGELGLKKPDFRSLHFSSLMSSSPLTRNTSIRSATL